MSQYILPAVLTAVFAFFVGLLLWLVKRERVALEYDVVESDAFPREGGIGKYFVCELKNTGNRAIENISFKIDVNKGVIDSIKYSSAQLYNVSEQTSSFVHGVLPLLNPKERYTAMLTIKDAEDDSNIWVEARAIGATASKKSNEALPYYSLPILVAAAAGVTISVALSGLTMLSQSRVTQSIERISDEPEFTKLLVEKKREWDEYKIKSEKQQAKLDEQDRRANQGEPENAQIIFSTLNRSGLSQVVPGLISITGDGLPFWKTGLYLMHSYLLDKRNAKKYVNVLIELANVESIAPSSKGFLLYLAGKIEKSEGNSDSAIRYFERCKKETPLMYEYLMTQDPAYNLASVKAWLTKNKIR